MFPNCFPFWHSAFWLLVLLSFRAAQARNETPRGTEAVLGYGPAGQGSSALRRLLECVPDCRRPDGPFQVQGSFLAVEPGFLLGEWLFPDSL